MRPIDADQLFKRVINTFCNECGYDKEFCNKECNIRDFIYFIRTANTINKSDIVSFYNKDFEESLEYITGYGKGYQEGLLYVLNDLKEFIQEYD